MPWPVEGRGNQGKFVTSFMDDPILLFSELNTRQVLQKNICYEVEPLFDSIANHDISD